MQENDSGQSEAREANRLNQLDPREPEFVPKKYTQTFKRSVYFPQGRGALLYQAVQIANRIGELGVNEIVAEALELWIDTHWIQYVKQLNAELKDIGGADAEYAEKLALAVKTREEELNRYNKSPERHQHFFYAVLNSMVECGWPEMSGTVQETIREDMIAADKQKRIDDKNSEMYDQQRKAKTLAKRLKKEKTRP